MLDVLFDLEIRRKMGLQCIEGGESPIVSIIIPMYNAEKYIEETLLSVKAQTYKNLDVIIINDGSTDGSVEFCQKFLSTDKRFRLVTQKNSGVSSARNQGLLKASGKYVFFLDADDFIVPQSIEMLVSGIEESPCDMIFSNFSKFEKGKIIEQTVSLDLENKAFQNKSHLLSKKEIGIFIRHFLSYPSNHLASYCWARLYKLSTIRKYSIFADERMALFEDFVFNLKYFDNIESIKFINVPLYFYRVHDTCLSASMKIINGRSLVNDMQSFRDSVISFFSKGNNDAALVSARQEAGHALFHYSIIFLVRSCRFLNFNNYIEMRKEIKVLINSAIFKKSLEMYRPKAGNSRLVPFFAKYNMLSLLIVLCYLKGVKRYG